MHYWTDTGVSELCIQICVGKPALELGSVLRAEIQLMHRVAFGAASNALHC